MGNMESEIPNESLERLKNFYLEVDEEVENIRANIAMIVQTLPGRRTESIGTGFFYNFDSWPFFITARHVLKTASEAIQKGQSVATITRGRKGAMKLNGLEFAIYEELDLAIAPLWKRPYESYKHVDFFNRKNVVELSDKNIPGFFVFTGFPTSRNKTFTKMEVKPLQRNITLIGKDEMRVNLDESPFLKFHFDPKNTFDEEFKRVNGAIPFGMSGGPVFSISLVNGRANLRLAGIGLACLPESKELMVLRFDTVDEILPNYFK